MESLLSVKGSFSRPCTEHYVTTDCLHTQLWWGTKAKLTEVKQPAAKRDCLLEDKLQATKRLTSTKAMNDYIYLHHANYLDSLESSSLIV